MRTVEPDCWFRFEKLRVLRNACLERRKLQGCGGGGGPGGASTDLVVAHFAFAVLSLQDLGHGELQALRLGI